MSKQARKLSATYLAKVISSSQFMECLVGSWNNTFDKDCETGFAIGHRLETYTPIYGRIIDSTNDDEVNFNERNARLFGLLTESLNFADNPGLIPLLDFHTHPNASFLPSTADIRSLLFTRSCIAGDKAVVVYPISIIAAFQPFSSNSKMDLLVLQEKPSPTPRKATIVAEIISNYLESTLRRHEEEDHNAILSALHGAPFIRAEVVSFSCHKMKDRLTFKSSLSKRNLIKILKGFAFTPQSCKPLE